MLHAVCRSRAASSYLPDIAMLIPVFLAFCIVRVDVKIQGLFLTKGSQPAFIALRERGVQTGRRVPGDTKG
jgi:hypothetical protein